MNPSKKLGKKGQIYHPQTRELISNIMKFMKKEAETFATTQAPLIPLPNYKQRVLAATGISHKTYENIMKEAALIEAGVSTSFSSPRKKKQKGHTEVENTQEPLGPLTNFEHVFIATDISYDDYPTVKKEVDQDEEHSIDTMGIEINVLKKETPNVESSNEQFITENNS